MPNILLSGILSALSYDLYPENYTLNQMKDDYSLGNNIPEALSWGQQSFSQNYFNNVVINKTYNYELSSFTAYIIVDNNTKQINVVFKGTEISYDEPYYGTGDLAADFSLFFETWIFQEKYVKEVYDDAVQLLANLRSSDPSWDDTIVATGHSLGGHLARTFSGLAAADSQSVECVVFNTPIPKEDKTGIATDVMIYSDPGFWGATGEAVHNAIKSFSKTTNNVQIIEGANGHGIVNIVNALNTGDKTITTEQYADKIVKQMIDGTLTANEYGSTAGFLERLWDNWGDRAPEVLNMIKNDFDLKLKPYQVVLDDNYSQDGLMEVFTQVDPWDPQGTIVVNAGTLWDVAYLGKGGISFDGGDHIDTVSYKLIDAGVNVGPRSGGGVWVTINFNLLTDSLFNVERFEGSQGNDNITSSGFDQIDGLAGNDTITGSDIKELIRDSAGDDYVDGKAGDDNFRASAGNDTLIGGAGEDALSYFEAKSAIIWDAGTVQDGFGNVDTVSDMETLTVTKFADKVTLGANQGIRMLYGGEGNDTLIGSVENGLLYGQAGDDDMNGGAGNDQLMGGEGNDTLAGGAGNDNLQGENGIDMISGGLGANNLRGGGGDDYFIFMSKTEMDYINDFEGAGTNTGDLICIAFAPYRFREYGDQNTLLEVDFNKNGDYDWFEKVVLIRDGAVTASQYSSFDESVRIPLPA